MNKHKQHYALYKQEEEHSFKGWDFSHLDGRWEMEDLPWSYHKDVLSYLKAFDTLLDMGTGDGSILKSFNHPYTQTFVTEGYLPNYTLCKETLEPLGISVHFCDDDLLPFEDQCFDIITNRHESFNLNEVYRVLKPGGIFITQQVGSDNSKDLSKKLFGTDLITDESNRIHVQVEAAKSLHFEVLKAQEYHARLSFFDVKAIVYYAKIIEWEFPNFSVDTHFDNLLKLEDELLIKGTIDSIEHRYILVLRK